MHTQVMTGWGSFCLLRAAACGCLRAMTFQAWGGPMLGVCSASDSGAAARGCLCPEVLGGRMDRARRQAAGMCSRRELKPFGVPVGSHGLSGGSYSSSSGSVAPRALTRTDRLLRHQQTTGAYIASVGASRAPSSPAFQPASQPNCAAKPPPPGCTAHRVRCLSRPRSRCTAAAPVVVHLQYMTECTFNWRVVKNICTECHVYDQQKIYKPFDFKKEEALFAIQRKVLPDTV